MALAQFEGTLVVVSHDRHLLRATTDQFIIVADGKLQPFDGDLDDYKDWLFKTKLGKGTSVLPAVNKQDELPHATPVAAPSAIDRRDQKKIEAEQRQRIAAQRKPIEARLKRVEEKMAKRNAQMAEIDAKLADQSIYDAAKKAELKTVLTDQTFYKKDLEQLEAEWLKEQEALEAIGAG